MIACWTKLALVGGNKGWSKKDFRASLPIYFDSKEFNLIYLNVGKVVQIK